jgi:two-component system nitrate/nitrite sensor histidine kinase NarX
MDTVNQTGPEPRDMATLSENQEANRLCGYVIGDDGKAVSGWKFDTLTAGRLALPCSLMLVMLIGIGLVALLMPLLPGAVPYLAGLQLLLAVLGLHQLRRMLQRMRHNVIEPLEQLRQWARVMRSGRLSARVEAPESGEFVELAGDINRLGERLEALTHEMDERVHKQTTRLAHQTRSLAILYEVAASINKYRDLDDLLSHFLNTLRDVTDARAATVRLIGPDKKMRLVASLGLDDEIVRAEQQISMEESCVCSMALDAGSIQCRNDIRECNAIIGQPIFGEEENITLLAVPLQYRGQDLGIYNLFLDEAGVAISRDFTELLTSIGRHLGMAIEKAYLDKQANRLSLMQERTMLAHELHDSLAQTIASLRYQVRMLDDTLRPGASAPASTRRTPSCASCCSTSAHRWMDAGWCRRSRTSSHGSARRPASLRCCSTTVSRWCCRRSSRCRWCASSRNRWPTSASTARHSQAQNVRVLVDCNEEGDFRALIEDDGVGIGDRVLDGSPGEHVGLSIMQERAQRLGGALRIESEPGDGTRIELTFHHQADEFGAPLPRTDQASDDDARTHH